LYYIAAGTADVPREYTMFVNLSSQQWYGCGQFRASVLKTDMDNAINHFHLYNPF